eukprot:TRINITY_DN1759_c0_g3_i2.p1 TRINITY_DN1759_c0_g3~~TRINITY_DN1759_c0_g3_i2.p1  ORF type:complete len:571 (+),score=154.22 TRINITY_DN1759_c0_g3_i2:228-1715(+)
MREDSFLVSVLRILLFSDVGTRYLVVLLGPIIKSVIEDTASNGPIELKNVSEEILAQNSERLIKILGSFLDTFQRSPFKCPLSLRQVFLMIQEAVDAKFTQDGILKAPLSLDIMFFKFICPTLIDPTRFHIVEDDVPSNVKPTLLMLSKILNDLALNNTDKPWGNQINNFILKNHEILVESLKILTNKEHIEQHRSVLESSFNVVESSQWDRGKSKTALIELLESAVQPAVKSLTDLKELKDAKVAGLKKAMIRPDWKPFKKTKDVTILWIRDGPWIYTKTTTILSAPIEWVSKNAVHIIQTRQVIGSSHVSNELLHNEPELVVGRCINKAFYPLANRELVVAFWKQVENEDLILMPGDNAPIGLIPKLSGTVLVEIGVGGFVFERHGFGTRVTHINPINAGEYLPKWAQRIFAKVMGKHGKRFKKFSEKIWHDPGLFTIPAVTDPFSTLNSKKSKSNLFSSKRRDGSDRSDRFDSSDSSRNSVEMNAPNLAPNS